MNYTAPVLLDLDDYWVRRQLTPQELTQLNLGLTVVTKHFRVAQAQAISNHNQAQEDSR